MPARNAVLADRDLLVLAEPILRAQAAAIRLGGSGRIGASRSAKTELVFAPPFTPRPTLGSAPANVRDVSGRLLSNLAELQKRRAHC